MFKFENSAPGHDQMTWCSASTANYTTFQQSR